MENIEIGIIGGSGFYKMMNLKDPNYIELDTPFGKPSEKILIGSFRGHSIAFLSRHGIGHRLNPSQVNYRANLFVMKMLNVKRIISITAVGSLKEEIEPCDLVIPDQFFDNTFKREKTFFDHGVIAHVSMAEPICPYMADLAFKEAKKMGINVHKGGTYFNMEGPQFSSKAESNTYRKLGFDIIGMTQAVEAKLAKELEICFLSLAFVTDYDCWHQEVESVTVEMVVKNLNENTKNANRLIECIIENIDKDRSSCKCENSLEDSIISDPGFIPLEIYKKLEPIICKYIKKQEIE